LEHEFGEFFFVVASGTSEMIKTALDRLLLEALVVSPHIFAALGQYNRTFFERANHLLHTSVTLSLRRWRRLEIL